MTWGERTSERRDGTILLRPFFLIAAACLPALIATGCGAPAAPQPPTLNLPQPVRDLTAARAGNTVHLTFSVPEKTTDKLPVRGPMTAQLCRATSDAGPCEPAGTLALTAQKTAAMEDALPADLAEGPMRPLTYRVAVLNHAQKSAGESSAAFAVAGAGPQSIAGFKTMPRRNGIVLGWQSVDGTGQATEWVRFDRIRTAGPSAPPPQSGVGAARSEEEPAEQSMRVSEATAQHRAGTNLSFALDATARTGRSYRYTAQRVEQVTLGKRTLELASAVSAPLDVVYRDVFPPSVPAGLISAVDTLGKAVDLSWTPDTDSGIAGYIVYRRAVGSKAGAAPERITGVTGERISGAAPVTAPAWRDTAIVAGQRYAYSVSAIDSSGNESERSAEIEDGLAASGP